MKTNQDDMKKRREGDEKTSRDAVSRGTREEAKGVVVKERRCTRKESLEV